MSKIKVNSLEGVGASTPAISIDNSSGTCTANITNRSNRNKIINGGMTVSQRQTSTTNSSAFVVDRFQAQITQMDELVQTLEQSSDAPDGFGKSIKITTTTPESSIASNEQFRIQTKLEGQDFQDLAYGSSAAKTITISFYVKASITGTFGFTVYRAESTARVITAPYTINSANTWERKTITISGDTAGAAITNDNTERFRLMWGLAAGANFNTASASWGNYSSANLLGGHVTNSLVTTNNATWQLTGVQLEVGSSVATDFEHRSYHDELLRCMRYTQKIDTGNNTYRYVGMGNVDNDGDNNVVLISFKSPFRSTVSSLTTTGSASDYAVRRDTTKTCTSVPTMSSASPQYCAVTFTSTGHGWSTGQAVFGFLKTSGSYLIFEAEL